MGTQQVTPGQREFISLADVGQFEEEMIEGYQGQLDANAQRVPLPHENYLFRVRYADNWPAKEGETPIPLSSDPNARWVKGQAKDGKTYWMTWIYVSTEGNTNPAHDGQSCSEILTTYVTKKGTTQAQALLQGFDVDTLTLNTHAAQVRELDKYLAGDGTIVGAETDWIARYFDKAAVAKDKQGNDVMVDGQQKTGVEVYRLRGMRRFPKEEDGTHRFTLTHADADKIPAEVDNKPFEIRAFNEIKRWVPASRLTAAGQAPDLAPALAASIANANAARQPAPVPVAATTARPSGPTPMHPVTAAPVPAQATSAQAAPPQQARPAAARPTVRRV